MCVQETCLGNLNYELIFIISKSCVCDIESLLCSEKNILCLLYVQLWPLTLERYFDLRKLSEQFRILHEEELLDIHKLVLSGQWNIKGCSGLASWLRWRRQDIQKCWETTWYTATWSLEWDGKSYVMFVCLWPTVWRNFCEL